MPYPARKYSIDAALRLRVRFDKTHREHNESAHPPRAAPERTFQNRRSGPIRTFRLTADHSYSLWTAVGWPQLKAVTGITSQWRDFMAGPRGGYRSQVPNN